MADESNEEARVFSVETRFQRLARRPGGVSRDTALERAQSNIERLKPEFAGWLDHELQDLTVAIRRLEGYPNDVSRIEEAHRRSCQLRDVGTTMGFELVTIISNNVCEILDAIKDGAPYRKDTVDCHLDALPRPSKAPYCHMRPEQMSEMIGGLRRLVEQATSSKSSNSNSKSN